MVKTLPDWWYKGRAPTPVISPLQVKWVGVAQLVHVQDCYYYSLVGPFPPKQVFYLHKLWLTKSDNALARLDLCWPVSPNPEDAPGGDVVKINGVPHYYFIIHREHGYEQPEIAIPKGLDYHSDWWVLVWIRYYGIVPEEHWISYSGVVEWL